MPGHLLKAVQVSNGGAVAEERNKSVNKRTIVTVDGGENRRRGLVASGWAEVSAKPETMFTALGEVENRSRLTNLLHARITSVFTGWRASDPKTKAPKTAEQLEQGIGIPQAREDVGPRTSRIIFRKRACWNSKAGGVIS